MATNTVEIPQTKMPAETVSKRLNRARIAFAKKQIKKSGRNSFLKFDYFTLDDIIPAAREVLTAEGLSIQFEKDRKDQCMCARVVDMDNPKGAVVFNTGIPLTLNPKTDTEVQMFGKMQTYSRRYLYLLVLDICEPDEIDAGAGNTSYTASTATYQQQKFDTNNNRASEEQMKRLRALYKECQRLKLCDNLRTELTRNGKSITAGDCEMYCRMMEKAIETHANLKPDEDVRIEKTKVIRIAKSKMKCITTLQKRRALLKRLERTRNNDGLA